MPTSAGLEPRLDSIEIKVTFSGERAVVATRALAPDNGGTRRRVYFCEALAPSRVPGQLPLLDAGVILRLRAGGGDGESGKSGDATVKLRPCRRSRLTERWLDFHERGRDSFTVESDWAGDHRVLSASLTSDRGRGTIDAVAFGQRPPGEAFSDRQRTFLADCADVPSASGFTSLDVLGPVRTVRWNDVRLDHHEVTLEHWTLSTGGNGNAPLEWFEVSERVAPEGAEVVQASLGVLLRGQGLEPDLKQGMKTRRVLEALAGEWPVGKGRSPAAG